MSASKFASITASLLARKGEARPWTEIGTGPELPRGLDAPEFASAIVLPMDRPAGAQPANEPCLDSDAPPEPASKKFSMRMTPSDYAQLGMLAARRGCSRQKFLQDVLRRILDGAALEFAAFGWRTEAGPRHKW